MSRPQQRVNHATFYGSLLYNMNTLTGVTPTQSDFNLHPDVVWDNDVTIDYVSGLPSPIPQNLYTTTAFQDGNIYYKNIIDKDEWEQGSWFLFNLKFLPFLAPPQHPKDPTKYLRRDNENYEMAYNSATVAVLIPTILTVAKVVGGATAMYYGTKLIYRLSRAV